MVTSGVARFPDEGLVRMILDQAFLAGKPLKGLVDLGIENPETVASHTHMNMVLGELIAKTEGLSAVQKIRLLFLLQWHSLEEVENANEPLIPRGGMSMREFVRFQIEDWRPPTWRKWRNSQIESYHSKVIPALEKALSRYPEDERYLIRDAVQEFYLDKGYIADLARQVHLLSSIPVPLQKVLAGERNIPVEAFVRKASIVKNNSCRMVLNGMRRSLRRTRSQIHKGGPLRHQPV